MFLKQLEISQIRAIEHAALDFRGESAAGAGAMRQRTVLIGDNACGKSTVLRAAALVLAGTEALNAAGAQPGWLGEPATWVRNGQKQGHIRAVLTPEKGADITVALTLQPGWSLRQTLAKNQKSLQALDAALAQSARRYFTLAYGASRRPSRLAQVGASSKAASAPANAARASASPLQRSGQLAGLLSPDAALVAFEPWAAGLSAPGKAALRALLKALLPGVAVAGIDASGGQVVFKTADGSIPFAQLSLAHQTLIAWCGDLLYRVGQAFGAAASPLKTSGLLLLDELELHLHPLHQRGVLVALSAALPNLQIMATSHSPMVVQQLRPGELVLLERATPQRGATARVVQGDPSQLTLGQLMAPMFGIDSTDSTRVAALRSRARSSPGLLAARDHIELASLSPIHQLPPALQAQLQATTELTEAVARSAGQRAPKLDPAKLREKMGERIQSAALRVGGGT